MADEDKTVKLERGDESRPSLDAFRQAWIDSGLHPASEIKTFFADLPNDLRTADAKSVAQHAVRLGKLTRYQAQAVLTGKIKALVLGSYVILDKLGQGGMGQVFRAKHIKMGRVVALKVLPGSATRSPEAVKRFHKEIQAAAKLSHPNIVTAHDAGEANRIHFLVMEYVDGRDLRAVLRERGMIPVATAVDYVLQAARGIDAAHRQGIVHRDIKPENLLLDSNGIVKVLDMGLARVADVLGDEAADEASLTRAGQVMGTPDYMAPEQGLDTKRAEARSDIYSLGCTLHTLLIGRPPFKGETLVEKILAHRDRPIPSLSQQRGDVPEVLDRLFQSMIAKRLEDRPATMSAVVDALEAILRSGMASSSVDPTVALLHPPEPAETATMAAQPTFFSPMPSIAVQAENRVQTLVKQRTQPTKRTPWIVGGVLGILALLAAILTPFFLRASTGVVALSVDQPGAKLTVRDASGTALISGQTLETQRRLELPAQQLQVTIELEGFETYRAPIEPKAGAEQTLAVRLKPLEREKPEVITGSVKLISSVPGVSVRIVDAADGNTKLHAYETGAEPEVVALPPGRYQILATKEGYDPYEASIRVTGRSELRHTLALRETLAINGDTSPSVPEPPMPTPEPMPEPMPMPSPMPEPPAWAGWPEGDPKPAIAPFDAREARRLQQLWAEHLGFGKRNDNYIFTNSIGITFVLIPPGEFLMGATEAEMVAAKEAYQGFDGAVNSIDSWGPQRRIIISRPFFLSAHEVTTNQYDFIMTGSTNPANEKTVKTMNPILAFDFCIELARKQDLPPAFNRLGDIPVLLEQKSYRLPTEAEWEFAARAGTTTRFWFGDDPSQLAVTEKIGILHEVPSLTVFTSARPNAFGLFDIHGNAAEITCTAFDSNLLKVSSSDPLVDPNVKFENAFLTIRGGHAMERAERIYVAQRVPQRTPDGGLFGIRLVLDVKAAQKLKETARGRR